MMPKAKKGTRKVLVWSGIVCGALAALLVLLIVLAPRYQSKDGWRTLEDVGAYAAAMAELPTPDNTNKVRPDYTTHHRAQLSGYLASKFNTIRSWIGLKKASLWSPSYFAHQLKEAVGRFAQHKVQKNVVYKVAPKVGTQFVVWGDLSGAYHSLVRGTQKLKELSILDNEFKIVADDTYLVFMGDAISRSPYGMETLSLILRLIEVNPDRVIYLRGNHEDKKYWHAFGLKEQLEARVGDTHEKALVPLVDQFFSYLPLGLYVLVPGVDGQYARLSHLGRARSKKLKEERFAHFLAAPQQAVVDRHQFSKSVNHSGAVKIGAIIRSEKKRHSFQTMDGIRLLEPDQGATSWTLMSSPTKVMQEGFKFFHDALAIIKVGASKARWSITLHAQDVRDKQGFTARSYQFFTGKQMSLEQIAGQQESAAPTKKKTAQIPASAQKVKTVPAPVATVPVGQISPFMQQFAQNMTRPKRIIKRVYAPAPAPKPEPVKIAAPVVTQTNQTTTVQPNGNQAVSVTVTPPVAGAKDQSTIVAVSVKVAAASGAPVVVQEDATEVDVEPVPTVTPVFRASAESAEDEDKTTSTALSTLRQDM